MMDKLKNCRALLIDLSGTLHVDSQPIKGSVEAINRLREASIKFIFATNTTKESKQSLTDKLVKIGFKIEPNEVFTSLIAASNLVKQQNLRPYLVLEDDAKKDFDGACDVNLPLNECDSLVVGLANKFDYKDMNSYFNFLYSGDKAFIGINKSRYFATRQGLSLGPGSFIRCLEYATNKKAKIVGKPNEEFFRSAVNSIEPNLPFENVCVIGDDLKDDVIGSQKLGMVGILVRTGKFKKEDEHHQEHKPNFVFDSVVEAIDHIIAIKNEPK